MTRKSFALAAIAVLLLAVSVSPRPPKSAELWSSDGAATAPASTRPSRPTAILS